MTGSRPFSQRILHGIIRALLPVALISLISLYLFRPIVDNDFFWHLRTGQWIWENRTLPQEDPFSLTTPLVYNASQKFVLTSYWLDQIILYALYSMAGPGGIVVFRFLIVGALVFILWISRRRGVDSTVYVSLLILFASSVLVYPVERPQFFSFLCFALLLYFLDGIRKGGEKFRRRNILLVIPVLMITWANLHGGHVIGQAAILLFIIAETLRYAHQSLSPLPRQDYISLLSAGVSGIIFSFINPNSFRAVKQVLGHDKGLSDVLANNVEYMTSLERYSMGNKDILLFWLFCLLCMVAFLLTFRRLDIARALLLGATGYFSFTTIRYIPFFMITALPFIARPLSKDRIVKFARNSLVAGCLCSAIYFGLGQRSNLSRLASGDMISRSALPVAAADFVLNNDLKGNMFNFSDWGGYLIWRLGPERKVFIDGRFLYPDTYFVERSIASGAAFDSNGLPYWKSALAAYDMSFIVMPLMSDFGETYPLMFELIKDKDWIPVYYSLNSMIFIKDSLENRDVISRNALSKDDLVAGLIAGCDRTIQMRPDDYRFHMARSDLNMYRGDFRAAGEGYRKVLELVPSYELPRQRLKTIEYGIR